MEAPIRDLMARMPLAEAVLTLWRWVADAESLDQIFDENRGRCYEKILPGRHPAALTGTLAVAVMTGRARQSGRVGLATLDPPDRDRSSSR